MKRTELFQLMKTWAIGEVILMTIYILTDKPIEKIVDACLSHANDDEINGALQKMGRSERIK